MGSQIPTVSVIVPVRDRPDLLALLFNALSKQDLKDFEVMIVDDGSRESVDAVVEDARRHGLRVGYKRTEGLGAVEARCVGVAEARGRILAFTDSDCEPEPRWLAAGVEAIDAGADLVQGVTRPARRPKLFERTLSYKGGEGLYATCNVFYRRSTYDMAGGFDRGAASRFRFRRGTRAQGLGFGEDTLLAWRVARIGVVRISKDAVVRHAVTRVDIREQISRAWQAGAFPALVREVPELRGTLLRSQIFIGSNSRLPVYLALPAFLAGLRVPGLALLAWWAGRTWRRLIRRGLSVRSSLIALPVELALDAVTAVALVKGSVQTRTPVL